jgi:hypothetical protein
MLTIEEMLGPEVCGMAMAAWETSIGYKLSMRERLAALDEVRTFIVASSLKDGGNPLDKDKREKARGDQL